MRIRSRVQAILRAVWVPLLVAPLLLAARCPVPGQSAFTSADESGSSILLDIGRPVLAVATTASSPTGEVAEGDLFRVLAPASATSGRRERTFPGRITRSFPVSTSRMIPSSRPCSSTWADPRPPCRPHPRCCSRRSRTTRWDGRGDGSNHLETFDASDPANVVPIDAVSFGVNEDLFATLFLGNRAFAVTHFRVDPFHTFEISDEGVITPGAHFEVSGWNDFFRPVFDGSRLIGIGVDDQGERSLAVSLYDVTDITNPEPLLDRERTESGASSVADWDHRGFSALENAVAVLGPGGVTETGLVLLPTSDLNEPGAGVQLFTFSAQTITRRGSMEHGSYVLRSFEADDDVVANLSLTELSLFATADPDQPVVLGRLELAPDFTDVFRFGEHWVRVVRRDDYLNWYFGPRSAPRQPTIVEVLPGDAHPDLAEPVAHFEIPADATLYRSRPYLVTVVYPATEPATETDAEVTVFDLRDPTQPVRAGVLLTDRLPRPWFLSLYRGMPGLPDMIAFCFYCFDPYPSGPAHVAAVPNGLAFLQQGPARSWTFDLLDLRDPAAPVFAERIASEDVALDEGTAVMDLLVDGSDAWVALKHAILPDRQGHSLARHFILRIDVSDPSALTAATPINVPGELISVDGDTIFTRDLQWTDDVLETAVVRLGLEPDKARVEAVHWFEDRRIDAVRLDGAGHVLVSHGTPWQWFVLQGLPQPQLPERLTVLDADSADLDVLSDVSVATGASLLDAIPGRALFRVGSGLLIFDLDDASNPRPRSFFGTSHWLEELLIEGRGAYSAGGRYGILGFDLDASNLAPPQSPSRLQ
jgi:hypothetical protein